MDIFINFYYLLDFYSYLFDLISDFDFVEQCIFFPFKKPFDMQKYQAQLSSHFLFFSKITPGKIHSH